MTSLSALISRVLMMSLRQEWWCHRNLRCHFSIIAPLWSLEENCRIVVMVRWTDLLAAGGTESVLCSFSSTGLTPASTVWTYHLTRPSPCSMRSWSLQWRKPAPLVWSNDQTERRPGEIKWFPPNGDYVISPSAQDWPQSSASLSHSCPRWALSGGVEEKWNKLTGFLCSLQPHLCFNFFFFFYVHGLGF